MVRSRRLLGLPVVDIGTGRSVGRVSRLLFDPRARRVSAFVVASGHWPAEDHVLEWDRARGIGQHAITIPDRQALAKPAAVPELQPLLRRPLRLYGTRVLTEDGECLGHVEELLIDPRTGEVTQVILAPGRLAHRLRGRSAIPAESVLVMGEDAMVVRSATVVQPSRSLHPARNGPGRQRPAPDAADGAVATGGAAADGPAAVSHAGYAATGRSGRAPAEAAPPASLTGQLRAFARWGRDVFRRVTARAALGGDDGPGDGRAR